MPGRIVDMSSSTDTNGINGVDIVGKPSISSSSPDQRLQHGTSSSGHASAVEQAKEGGAVNGSTELSNGTSQSTSIIVNGLKGSEKSGVHSSGAPEDDPPPELAHLTTGYTSLGPLIERAMQESFNEFTTLVENTSQLPITIPHTAGTNGMSSSLVNGTSHTPTVHQKLNAEKRVLWIEWARNSRDKFIKLLILAQWARANSQSIQVLIDMKQMFDVQDAGVYNAAVSIGQLKKDLFPFRRRSPDIKTAWEILAIEKDPRMPDLDMLPLKTLTHEKMLRTLRNMNALLKIRLNLHEELPWHLRDWRVHDGRATFSSSQDFEFDVTIASEELSQQLFFVDLRFLFSPAPIIGDNRIRDTIQLRADEALSLSGISGCFDMLHNFVLTHKITTLQSQAINLAKTTWTGNLRIEMVHRWLIIQYWTNEHYAKSWIEVGISSETSHKSLPGHISLPRLRTRWRQFGKLVENEELDLRLSTINVGGILRRAIARHSLEILSNTASSLREAAGSSGNLQTVLEESVDEPADCRLRLRLGKYSSESILSIEPITGRFSIAPSCEVAGRAQFELNRLKNPLDNTFTTIETFLCLERLSRLGRQAVLNAWDPVRALRFASEYLATRLGHRIVQYGAFKPVSWTREAQNWMLLVTINLECESWWAVEVLSTASGNTLGDIHNMDFSYGHDYVNADGFNMIDQTSIRSLTLGRTIRELQHSSIHVGIHWMSQAVPEQYRIMLGQGRNEPQQIPTITILASEIIKSISAMPKPHPHNFQLILGRYNSVTGKVAAIVRGTLPWTSRISDMISTAFDPSVTFTPQGFFTLQLEAPIGASFHTCMIERLNLLVRTTSFLTSLKAHRITPTNSIVSQITFHYPNSTSPTSNNPKASANSDPKLSCEITFSPDTATVPSIRFLPPSTNPHLRIRESLSELFAKKSANNFLAVLHLTLPLLRALQRVELKGNTIRYWSLMKYRIVYRAASTVFEIVCKPAGGSAEFHVYETRAGSNHPNAAISRPQGYEEMMTKFFSTSAPGIRPLKTMLVCNADSIEHAIDDLDRLVRDKIATAPLVAPTARQQQHGMNPAMAAAQAPPNGPLQRQQLAAGRGMPTNAATQHQAQQRFQQQQRLAQQHQQQQQQRQREATGGRGAGPNANSHIVILD